MVAQPTVAPDLRKQLREAGFDVVDLATEPETIEVKNDNCSRAYERNAKGDWEPLGPPCFNVRGVKCRLEDRGYQKFWCYEGKRFPVRVRDLRTLQQFDEEVKAILGLKSLYHESLGTTSARSSYDRLQGRPDK